ncbi:MAG: hypothetical protein AAFN74_09445 [Myxococcota bacterium]
MKIRIILTLGLLFLLFRWVGCGPAPGRGPASHLLNRVWFDRLPVDARDMTINLFLLDKKVDKKRAKFGVVGQASKFQYSFNALKYRLEGNKLTFHFLQADEKATFKVRTWPCKEAPKPFDLCLELRRGDRSAMLYSSRKQRFGRRHDAAESMTPAEATSISSQPGRGLPAVLEALMAPERAGSHK